MEIEGLLRVIRNAMKRIEVRYLVTGSMATIAYGEPRFTNVIDVAIELRRHQIDSFFEQFPESEFYVSKAAITQAVSHGFQFNVIVPASGLKVDSIVLTDSAFDTSRLARRRQLEVLDDGPVWFSSPEDVILKKMAHYKEGESQKHLRDIAGVLRVQDSKIDMDYIQHWVSIFQVQEIWNKIIASTRDDDHPQR